MNLIKSLAMASSAALLLTACSQKQADDEQIIDRPDFKSQTGVFDIDALEALGRVTEPVVSLDGKKILFGISYELSLIHI